jgi:hypothetical protein
MVATGSPRHDHRSAAGGHGQHPAVGGRNDRAFGFLLGQHRPLCFSRGDLVARDLDIGRQLRQPLTRDDATFYQRLAALEFGFCCFKLGGIGCKLRIECGDLEGDLVILDQAKLLSGGHQITLADRQFLDHPADPGTRRHDVAGFDTRLYGFPFSDFGGRKRQRLCLRHTGGDGDKKRKAEHFHGLPHFDRSGWIAVSMITE